jgi:hypothetical protein
VNRFEFSSLVPDSPGEIFRFVNVNLQRSIMYVSKHLVNLDVVGYSNHQHLLCSAPVSSGSHGLLTDMHCFECRTVRSQEKGNIIQKQHAKPGERFDIASMHLAKTV